MFHATLGCNKLRKFFWFCLFLPMFGINGYSIIFVHLGDRLPDYLSDAAKQARLFNPSAELIVIAEEKAIRAADQKFFLSIHAEFVPCETLQESEPHRIFRGQTTLHQGFWRKCTERFFYIEELMCQRSLKDVFHMEYDNMLYADLQELLPVFHLYPHIAATFDNDNRCIPGFIYFAHVRSTTHLVKFITDNCKKGLNDMEVIAQYRRIYGQEYIGALPIIMPEYALSHVLITPTGHIAAKKEPYSFYFEKFKSIFDAAALGQYLGGIDPNNGPSEPGFINESCVFNPSLLTYEWQLDHSGRKVPYAEFEGVKCRINNLHIHSKRLNAFAS